MSVCFTPCPEVMLTIMLSFSRFTPRASMELHLSTFSFRGNILNYNSCTWVGLIHNLRCQSWQTTSKQSIKAFCDWLGKQTKRSDAYTQIFRGRGNSIMVSVSVCEAGRPGLSLAWSVSQKGGDLPACYQLVPTSADDWFNKGRPCVVMSVIMLVKDP